MENIIDIYEQLNPEIQNSIAFVYKQQKDLFDWKTIRKEKSVKKLEIAYSTFQSSSDEIIILSKEYFKKELDCKIGYDNKRFWDLSNIYIDEIQNLYLNPINYRLNQLNNKKSLKVAWIIAIVSLFFSIASIAFTYYYGKNPTPCSCCNSLENPTTEQLRIINEPDSSKLKK